MTHDHGHGHQAHRAAPGMWEEKAEWLDEVVDALEPELHRVTQALLDAVHARPGTRLLDLACGVGNTSVAAAARGADVLGLDLTPALVDAARRRAPALRFEVGDMLHPPAGPWDAIVCRLGAHHVDPRWMTQARGVLVPGGRIAIAELAPTDADSVRNGMRPAAEWVDALAKAGFHDVQLETIELQLGSLAARHPLLAQAGADGDHRGAFRDGPIHIISGQVAPHVAPPARR